MKPFEQRLARRMVMVGAILVVCGLPFGFSFACAFESLPFLSMMAMAAPTVIGGMFYIFGLYLAWKKYSDQPVEQKPVVSKFVVGLLFGELTFIGMLDLTSVVADLTHSGIGMCGFFGSGWFMLPLLASIPVSIVIGTIAARQFPPCLFRMAAA